MTPPNESPERWNEPFVEALWRPDLLMGCPPFTHLHWIIWAFVCVFVMSFKPLIIGGLVQYGFIQWTKADPEWPAVIRDFLKTPDDVDL